ncbi:class C sortase, partial [Leucobacter soli]
MTGLTKERPRSAERPEHDDDPHGTSAASTASEVAAATGRASHLGRAMPIALQFGAMLGIGALLYPAAADWFATLQHDARISGYVEQVAALPDELRIAELDAAHDYNAHLPEGVLRDPYGGEAEAPAEAADDAYLAYQDVLRVDDDGVIGRLSYADLGISLPVYHGTSERVLTNGVGHLYGSSLPVGGPSTHSVLTSHAGLVHAALFTRLPQAEYGDVFQIDVLGETHYYQVDDIRTVLPEETGSLRIVDGEDFVTLITCTPTGINSHRLLVRGARIDAPESASRTSIPGDGRGAGFPWWAVLFVAGSAVTASLLFAPSRRSRSDRAMPA